jgi:hypothetical protein
MCWPLLAQTLEPLSGNAGWVGAGLLGALLAWLLLKHLPDKDRQTRELTAGFTEQVTAIRKEFREALFVLLDHHSKQVAELTAVIERGFDRMCNLLESAAPPAPPSAPPNP